MRLAILGATGRTGRLVLEQALARGDEVRALVREPTKLNLSHPRLTVVQGDAMNATAISGIVEGMDAVVSALGVTGSGAALCATAARHVVAAQVKRYVSVSGAGVTLPTDEKRWADKAISWLVKTLQPAVFHDKVQEHEVLAGSAVGWTLLRAPRLVNGPAKGQVKVSLQRSPGTTLSRADLARFLLTCVNDASLVGQAPFVAS